MSTLTIEQVVVGYGVAIIIDDLNVTIPENKITTIIGPWGTDERRKNGRSKP